MRGFLCGIVLLCGACGAGDLNRDNPNDRTNAACGNGAVDPGELCDDANAIDEDGCRRDCTLAFCGDGVVRRDIVPGQPGFESCDDGNTEGGDGCSSTCQNEACGNGVVDPGETCDDGNSDNDDRCTILCQPPGCGDGLLYRDEVCDDGNTDDTDACRNDCSEARCGDGVTRTDLNETQEGYEACDDANNDEEDGCASTCRIQGCGDGIRQSDEFCDDGDTRDDNACRADCQAAARCGDGVRRGDLPLGSEGAEECDDGNRIDYDACTSDCLAARCGDGILRTDLADDDPDFEACDDGNDEDADACLNRCTVAVCNDGVLRADVAQDDPLFEVCDDGNDDSADGCTVECKEHACMDGFVQDEEECDDGNTENGDACTNGCVPARCGDGIHRRYRQDENGDPVELTEDDEAFEGCDDGNEVDVDACINACRVARCGDQIIRRGLERSNPNFEDCDDGNEDVGDDCSGCRVEPVEVALGYNSHVCLRLTDGRVLCRGQDFYGALGNGLDPVGTNSNRRGTSHFTQVRTIDDATSIVAGQHSTCAIRADNSLWCWGWAGRAEDSNFSNVPVRVSQHNNVRQAAITGSLTCHVTTDNQVFCRGFLNGNLFGGESRFCQQDCSIATGQQVTLGSNFMCILNRGRVRCAGYNRDGQLGRRAFNGWDSRLTPVLELATDVEQVNAGREWACARRRTGAVSCWGRTFPYIGNGYRQNQSESATPIANLADAESLFVGGQHACARRRTNHLFCWGGNI
ncbi:MAG: DUF4215 domain-containing protein, partial [Myxococcota bacterium]|nr:DUF4215 domain-containing protein [Myxococcota bacterium]